MSPYRFRIPFTSANLGPGFDLFGMALDLYAEFSFELRDGGICQLFDENQHELRLREQDNYIEQAYRRFLALGNLENPPGYKIQFRFALPPSRGFGSSAIAWLAGLTVARKALENTGKTPCALEAEIRFLAEMEGHADNAAAARLGGWVFIPNQKEANAIPTILRKELPDDLALILSYPDYSVSTRESRGRLPEKYATGDVLQTISGALYWIEFLNSGNLELLRTGLQTDCLHEPYRATSIPHFNAIRQVAIEAGALGTTISGSGPGLISFCSKEMQGQVLAGMQAAAKEHHLKILPCRPSNQGLQYY